jgi:hypothetical protein
MEAAKSLQSAPMTRKLPRNTAAALALSCILLCVACGKRGDPRPPVPVIPKTTTDLAVTQRADRVILSWSYPSLTTAGRSLTDIRRISVLRYVEELPASAAGEAAAQPADSTVPPALALFAKIPMLPTPQFEKLSSRLDSIEKANLASATAGSRLLYTDSPPLRAADGRAVRITYAVVTESASARGEVSNLAVIVPLSVAVAPSSLAATPKPEGVFLTWQEPDSAAGAGKPVISGYHVYRAAPGDAPDELAKPIDTALVKGTTYTDVPPYGEHEYRVTAVADEGPPLAQSELSSPARAKFSDLVAPPTPTGLNALLETKLVRLIWDPVVATDLAGYRLYRTEGMGHDPIREIGTVPLVNEIITATSFVDANVNLGISYRYGVAAVDKNGNESTRTWTDWVIAPKTP